MSPNRPAIRLRGAAIFLGLFIAAISTAAEPETVTGQVTAVDFQAKTFTVKTDEGEATFTVVRSTVGLQLVKPGVNLEITYNPDDKIVSEVKTGSSPMAWLREQGLTSTGTTIYLRGESDLRNKMRESDRLLDDLGDIARAQQKIEKEIEATNEKIRALIAEHVAASAQLANIQEGDVAGNNRLVGRLNALRGQVEIEEGNADKLSEKLKQVLSQLSEKQGEYTTLVRELRPLADSLVKRYEEVAKDERIAAATAQLSALEGKEYKVGPSRTYDLSLKRLAELEKRVESQSIVLRSESNTFMVDVVLNGNHRVEMVFDTGASLISLPSGVARAAGLVPTDADQTIILTIADGRMFNAKRMMLKKVQVGQFEVEDVECAVLPEELSDAPVLLGGSFLRHFNYTLDPAGSKVTLVRVQATAPPER